MLQLAIVLALVATVNGFSNCFITYATDVAYGSDKNVCNHLEKLILCLGNDAEYKEADLTQLNIEKNKHAECEVVVQPTMTVVNRQLRIVTETDVKFNRFRRDEVGVFEIRDMVNQTNKEFDALTASVENRFGQLKGNFSQQDERVTKVAEAQVEATNTLKDQILSVKSVLEDQIDFVDAFVRETQGGVTPVWLHAGDVGKIPFGEPTRLRIVGKNFRGYYDGYETPTFQCIFTPDAGGKAITNYGFVEMEGIEVSNALFVLRCDTPSVPASESSDVKYTLSLKVGTTNVTYLGFPSLNKLTFSTVARSASASAENIFVHLGEGFTVDDYACQFRANGRMVTVDGELSSDKLTVTCETPLPGSFAQSQTPKSMKFSIGVGLTRNSKSVAFSSSTSPKGAFVEYDYCNNGRADEFKVGNTVYPEGETDVDCGGSFCSGRCSLKETCSVNTDCDQTRFQQCINVDNKKTCTEAGDGQTKERAGQTCKQILSDYPTSTNNVYWIRGIRNVLPSAVQVYCWLEDRDGGGWMLGIKHGYTNARDLSQAAFNSDKTTASDLLTSTVSYQYKLDDVHIRAAIGQTTSFTSTTRFDMLMDQVGFNSYYGAANREYAIMRNYEAHWEFNPARTVRNSRNWGSPTDTKNRTYLESYKIPNFDGKDAVGDGTLIWKGKTKCYEGSNGRRGVFCSSAATSGSVVVGANTPSRGTDGGGGCTINLSRGLWSGSPHFVMWESNRNTYMYLCNGAQHSSSYNMVHRLWFRSSITEGTA